MKSQTKSKPASRAPRKTAFRRRPAKSGYINARVESKLKKSAEAVLDKIGLTTTDAVTLFLTQVVAHRGMPFLVNIPNRKTINAMRELDRGGGTKHLGDVGSIFATILQPRLQPRAEKK